MIRNTINAYGSVAKFFHWLIFVLLGGMLIYGFFLDDFPKDVQPVTYNIHKLIGLTILTLVILRLIWRLTNITPALPKDVPLWQRKVERCVHYGLYLFMIVMPCAGWIGSTAGGHYPHLGSFELSLPIEKNKELAEVAFGVHNTVAVILITLISLHVLAALYHYFIKRDEILQRML